MLSRLMAARITPRLARSPQPPLSPGRLLSTAGQEFNMHSDQARRFIPLRMPWDKNAYKPYYSHKPRRLFGMFPSLILSGCGAYWLFSATFKTDPDPNGWSWQRERAREEAQHKAAREHELALEKMRLTHTATAGLADELSRLQDLHSRVSSQSLSLMRPKRKPCKSE